MNTIRKLFRKLETHVEKPWYPWVLGFIFGADHFILFLPLDALLVTSIFAAPRRWISLFLSASIGFTLGATLFAYLVQLYGVGIVEKLSPGITHHPIWLQSENWMQHYGLFAVGGISMIPMTLHPLVALAALHGVSLILIALAMLVGRLIRYFILGRIASHAPTLLLKFKFFRKEVDLFKDSPSK